MSIYKSMARGLLIGLATAVVLTATAAFVLQRVQKSRQQLPVLGQVPDFQFTERMGQPFGLADMKGKINVVDFIFTNCPGACPIMSSKMVQLYRQFKGSGAVRFVSISVDPDRDSLKVLQNYAQKQGVDDDAWVFLRAPIDRVVWLSEKGFMLPAENLPMGHTTRFVLVDQQGQIRGYYEGLQDSSISVLKKDIEELVGTIS